MTKPRVLPLGPVSAGTTLKEDLIPAFLDAANKLRLSGEQRANLDLHRLEWDKLSSTTGSWTGEQNDEAAELLETLFGQLNDLTPDFCYFGAQEGDGACYGVWPDSYVPFHGPATDEIGKGDCLPPANDAVPDHFLVVNDHGNATMYRKRRQGRNHRWVECWSVV